MPTQSKTTRKPPGTSSRPPTTTPKSILKKPTSARPAASSNHVSIASPSSPRSPPPSSSRPPAARDRDEHNRALALHHANLIQQRKDLELDILLSLEDLVDAPSAATPSPANPTPEDVKHVLGELQRFTPGDFDSLIQERNINKKCGYVLCPRPARREGRAGKFRLVHGVGGKSGLEGFRVVNKKDLEKWCEEACARRAGWLRVQMSDLPAWERMGGGEKLELWDEEKGQEQEGDRDGETDENMEDADDDRELRKPVNNKTRAKGNAGVEGLAQNLNKLALERGEKDANSFRGKTFDIALREKTTSNVVAKPPDPGSSHKAVDGYTPKVKFSKNQSDSSESEDSEDSDEDDEDDDDDEDIMDTL